MIEVIDNFFSEELANKLHVHTVNIMNAKRNVFSTNYWWNEKLRKEDKTPPVLLVHNLEQDVYSQPLAKEVVDYLAVRLPDMHVMGILFHMMTPGSYIGEHRDGAPDRSHALTIYLNSLEWDVDKGGSLLYNDPNTNESGSVIPKFNRAVLLSGDVFHEVTPVEHGHVRKSLQLWLKQRD